MLILLSLDRQMGDVIVNLPISGNLPRQTPVIGVGHSSLEDLELATQASEYVTGLGAAS
jgi:hypothetical protein